MNLKYISASRLKVYLQCPLQYHAVYDLEVEEPPPHPLTVMGSALHKAMEISTRALVMERHESLWDPRGSLMSAVVRKYDLSSTNRDLMADLIENAIEMGWYEDIDHTDECEREFTIDVGSVDIHGFIDRLDLRGGTAIVNDLKTTKRIPSLADLSRDWQPRIYSIAAFLEEGCDSVVCRFWYLRAKTVHEFELSRVQAEEDTERLNEFADEIRGESDPSPTPGAYCRFCRYKKKCPVGGSIKQRMAAK